MEKLYSVSEAAEALRASRWSVYRWMSQGKLQRTRVANGRVTIRESELQRLVKDGQRSTRGRKS